MKKIIKFISGKLFITCILILLQIIAYFMMFYHISRYSPYIYGFMTFLSVFFAFKTAIGNLQSDFKTVWIFFFISVPIFSWIIYIIIRKKKLPERKIKLLKDIDKTITLPKDTSLLNFVNDDNIKKQMNYIVSTTEHSIYDKTSSKFFPMGECFFESLEKTLKKAEKFIFLEYFIINNGNVWNRILDILKNKAKNGVEIRILYDDIGTINLLPYNFRKNLEKYGIKSAKFNPLTPYPDISANYRDHRKIAVIDGKYAYTGGINLSDEYSNEKERFGIWKDYGILIKGKAVREMTALFLKMWDYNIGKIEENPNKYFSDYISENEINELDYYDESRRKVDLLLNQYMSEKDGRPVSDFKSAFCTLLFNNLIRFIGDDYTPFRGEELFEYPTEFCVSQKIHGKYNMTLYIDMPRETCIEFASRYVGEAFDEFDEYVEASVMDFLNLHNGLFCVNESNSDDVELTLEPPVVESDPLLIFDDAMSMLPVIYPFGTINFIFEVNNQQNI